ncbi:unnamed protein product [Parajaminaea phylloscopi]
MVGLQYQRSSGSVPQNPADHTRPLTLAILAGSHDRPLCTCRHSRNDGKKRTQQPSGASFSSSGVLNVGRSQQTHVGRVDDLLAPGAACSDDPVDNGREGEPRPNSADPAPFGDHNV